MIVINACTFKSYLKTFNMYHTWIHKMKGIILAGGGSLLKGIDQIIRERTNVPVNVSEDPLLSVVKGTGMVLENLKKYEAVLL